MHARDTQYCGPAASLERLDTPTLIVDLDRLERNIRRWQRWMDERGTPFRVHVKTHKVPEIALAQIDAGARGIICAKPSEAEPFVAAGIGDVCVAYPVIGAAKWQRIAAMAAGGTRLTVNCDSTLGVGQASDAATAAGVSIRLQIDIDSGLRRGGIPVDDVDAVEALARAIENAPGVEFDGITTHRSFPYGSGASPSEEGHREGAMLVALAQALRNRGLSVREVTAGGTVTARYVAEVDGITEARAGTYVFNDLMQLAAGSASEDELALSVLCTVVSLWGDRLTIDAGSKTFSGDRGSVAAGSSDAEPPIVAQSLDGRVLVERLTEEHGMGRSRGEVTLGEKLRFYPFHACTCANLSSEMVVLRDERVTAVWRVAARGLRT
jgi:D-serine deaminase-like pyridoxal phosphate-dependent protein